MKQGKTKQTALAGRIIKQLDFYLNNTADAWIRGEKTVAPGHDGELWIGRGNLTRDRDIVVDSCHGKVKNVKWAEFWRKPMSRAKRDAVTAVAGQRYWS